jgi:hypothetical protein
MLWVMMNKLQANLSVCSFVSGRRICTQIQNFFSFKVFELDETRTFTKSLLFPSFTAVSQMAERLVWGLRFPVLRIQVEDSHMHLIIPGSHRSILCKGLRAPSSK